jgi:hypothetical protein
LVFPDRDGYARVSDEEEHERRENQLIPCLPGVNKTLSSLSWGQAGGIRQCATQGVISQQIQNDDS